MKPHNNVIQTDQFQAANKLVETVTWLENNRHHLQAVLKRGPGSPMYSTVLSEVRNLAHELHALIAALPK